MTSKQRVATQCASATWFYQQQIEYETLLRFYQKPIEFDSLLLFYQMLIEFDNLNVQTQNYQLALQSLISSLSTSYAFFYYSIFPSFINGYIFAHFSFPFFLPVMASIVHTNGA
ncbi:MAG: hypothetical protein HY819_06520 [Acidobacteria bacterium]|nr:hypothetical protein [Acidobacteriota bacterium]